MDRKITFRLYLPVFLFVQVGSISSHILAQFEFYIDLEFIRLCMLPFVRDMASVGFRRSSFAFQSQWEPISDGDVGLKVAYNGMRGPYVHLEEPFVGPPETNFRQLYNALFLPELTLGGCALSVGFIAPSACLRRCSSVWLN